MALLYNTYVYRESTSVSGNLRLLDKLIGLYITEN